MKTTKVFKSGNSQAVRIPREYKIDSEELCINKVGNTIVLFPKNDPWEQFKKSLTEFSDDFFADGRNQPAMQVREEDAFQYDFKPQGKRPRTSRVKR